MTIYDIAKEAGVAASTVSRVINNKPGIREETRKRVRDLLEKYHYTPNEAARGLVTQSSRSIGILIEDIRVSHHTESAYVIEQAMTARGYCCITLSTGPEEQKKREYVRILGQRRVDGAILIGSMLATEAVKESIEKHLKEIPVAIVNGALDLPNVHGVLTDEAGGIRSGVRLMAGKGKRKLAFIRDSCSPSNLEKENGFIAGMLELGRKREDLWIYRETDGPGRACGDKGAVKPLRTTRESLREGYHMALKILEDHPDVEGMIFSIDLLAAGGIQALTERGVKVPGQVAVMGVDNTIYGELCSPRLTTLDNKLEQVSAAASRILLDALEGKENPQKMMLFTDIIEREST